MFSDVKHDRKYNLETWTFYLDNIFIRYASDLVLLNCLQGYM